MNNDFNKALWKLGEDRPELQKAIARTIVNAGGYVIPTRKLCKATGEVEDIHIGIADIEDEEHRGKLIQAIRKADSLTVRELAQLLSWERVDLCVREAKGETLTEEEKTLRDIDITTLALYAILKHNQ